MNPIRSLLIRSGLAATVTAAALVGGVGPWGSDPSGATTDPSTLSGQGGSFLQPVMEKLVNDDSANLAPLYGAYTNTAIDAGIASFAGSGPGQFGADFAVSERPLTAAETATATSNGRSFAYVPFAATPVAIVTLVPSANWGTSASQSITSSDFCQDMPLSVTQLGELFGIDTADPLTKWADARIDCPETGGGNAADNINVSLWANLDPSMSNKALMSLLDSTPTSKSDFDAGLAAQGSLTTDDTPSELWPYSGNTIPGGDEPLLGKLLGLNSETNAPSNDAIDWALGAIAPISSVWTGAPLGVPWNIPTAAIDNAAGDPVAPSTAAAAAAEGDATVAATSSPTTNNLVTFVADPADPAAYNNYLMEESYLVVPTNGLPAAKATGLAQFIRFVVGPQGQQDIKDFGAAGATSAMVTADLKVAAELDADAVAATNPTTSVSVSSSTTTTTTTAAGTTTASGSGASGAGTTSDAGASGTSGDGSSTGTTGTTSGLAFTGSPDVGALVVLGLTLFLVTSLVRRRLRRREVPS